MFAAILGTLTLLTLLVVMYFSLSPSPERTVWPGIPHEGVDNLNLRRPAVDYSEYVGDIEEGDDVFTIAEFIESCQGGSFIDYDGFGEAVRDGKIRRGYHQIYPSELDQIPLSATHIIWYNR